MEDYKLKYLKYKKKYINLKSELSGGALSEEEYLSIAKALSEGNDAVVPQGEAKKSLAEKQAESRDRAEKAANDELQRILRETAVPQGEAKKSLAEKQAESRARAKKAADDELQEY